MPTPGFLNKRHTAERLDVSTKTVDRLRASGELLWRRVGSRVVIAIASIEAYEANLEGRQPDQKQPGPADEEKKPKATPKGRKRRRAVRPQPAGGTA